jgi:hypothetical protein
MILAHEHQLKTAFEEILSQSVEIKRLTHAVHPDACDRDLPKVLLNLRRDEDAIAFIRYWFKWRPPGPGQLRDPLALLSKRGECFRKEENRHSLSKGTVICSTLLTNFEMQSFQQGDYFSACLPVEEMEVPSPFCFVALVIKRHHICVHCI